MTTASKGLTEKELVERDALVGRLYESTIGALELLHVYLGDRLGLYRALATAGPLTAAGLASTAGINQRYAREWLEQEAVAGILVVDGDDGPDGRRYSLPRGHAEVLIDTDSINYFAPAAGGVVAIGRVMSNVMEAFRNGGGVPYEAYGEDMRSSISSLNRPGFLNLLGTKWFPSITDVDQRLRSQPPARVADVGCGTEVVQHRHREGVSTGSRGCLRHRRGFDRRRPSKCRGERSCGSDQVRGSRRGRPEPCRAV